MTSGQSRIVSLLWRRATRGDFFNIERARDVRPARGGGQLYIDIPLGGGLQIDELGRFLQGHPLDSDDSTWIVIDVEALSVGAVNVAATLTFSPRKGKNRRYRIANQNRQSAGGSRHPAWRASNGFPQAPDDVTNLNDLRMPDLTDLKFLVAKDQTGDFYASYINRPTIPPSWPAGVGLEVLFGPTRWSDGLIELPSSVVLGPEDLALGMEATTLAEELAETLAEEMTATGQFDPASVIDARDRTLASIVRRRGQPAFRQSLIEAYESRCAITDCDVVEALEAAHIVQYQGPETNTLANGILLRSDLHTLFDMGLFSIDSSNMTILLAPQLAGTHYDWLENHPVRLPANHASRPSVAALNQQRNAANL